MTAGSGTLAAELAARLPEAGLRTAFGQTAVTVPVASWHAAARIALADLGCTAFDWLGVEDAGRPGSAGQAHAVLLHVVRPPAEGLLLRTSVGAEDLPSVADLWAGAAWHEREAAEMFGIAVPGVPGHLLLPGTFTGHPLRKDFVLASRVVRPWPGGLEPGESVPSRRRLTPPGVPGPDWGPRREDHP